MSPLSSTKTNSLPSPDLPSPLIANAPMAGFAGPHLAAAVTRSGGLGFLGTATDMTLASRHLSEVRSLLSLLSPSQSPPQPHDSTLPIGIGFLLFLVPLSSALPLITDHRPHAVWLSSAPTPSDYTTWTTAIRSASPQTQIWIQVGSVATALDVARSCAPDVIVCQGIDAGGHGLAHGAGVVSLIPEISDALARELSDQKKKIRLVAAGGIVDGRGVAAAVALGAEGAVLGTRFLASSEVMLPHPGYLDCVLGAGDGGQSTVRSTVFDEVRGLNTWPEGLDGRGLVNETWRDWREGGVEVGEVRRRWEEAVKRGDGGFGVKEEGEGEGDKDGNEGVGRGRGRATVWAGTGVGLVREVKGAGEIVEEVRGEARRTLGELGERFGGEGGK